MLLTLGLVFLFTMRADAQLQKGVPGAVGMSAQRLQAAAAILEGEVASGKVGAASILVARRGQVVLHRGFGKMGPGGEGAEVQPDSVYLLASITKPVAVSALLLLVDRGQVLLNEPVWKYLPEFKGEDRAAVRVRDLLSHTSGLPDMLPQNTELRRAHAPLSKFVEGSMTTRLLYPPRQGFQYQSMGILLAAEIVERITKKRLRDFLQEEMFTPLGMKDSALGMKPGVRIGDTVWCDEGRNPNSADSQSFGPNSAYWRDMGHPWGGMHSTTTDLALLLQTFLNKGTNKGKRWMSQAAVTAMTSDQNGHLPHPWGLGWALGRSTAWMYFGDLVSAKAFGHSGATGTVAWADPERDLITVILTNRPVSVDDGALLRRVSNAVTAAVE
ncbi:MAG: beta-lactamase family protein [Bryobacterales bacterium]|nr:beta-lactamase family protein [Bryobacterales bacterium]